MTLLTQFSHLCSSVKTRRGISWLTTSPFVSLQDFSWLPIRNRKSKIKNSSPSVVKSLPFETMFRASEQPTLGTLLVVGLGSQFRG